MDRLIWKTLWNRATHRDMSGAGLYFNMRKALSMRMVVVSGASVRISTLCVESNSAKTSLRTLKRVIFKNESGSQIHFILLS